MAAHVIVLLALSTITPRGAGHCVNEVARTCVTDDTWRYVVATAPSPQVGRLW